MWLAIRLQHWCWKREKLVRHRKLQDIEIKPSLFLLTFFFFFLIIDLLLVDMLKPARTKNTFSIARSIPVLRHASPSQNTSHQMPIGYSCELSVVKKKVWLDPHPGGEKMLHAETGDKSSASIFSGVLANNDDVLSILGTGFRAHSVDLGSGGSCFWEFLDVAVVSLREYAELILWLEDFAMCIIGLGVSCRNPDFSVNVGFLTVLPLLG